MKAVTTGDEWYLGEGRYICEPSWENYGHVILRLRLSDELAHHVIEFDVRDDFLPEKYRPAIADAAVRWLAEHADVFGSKKARVVIFDGSWYGIGSRHREATGIALAQATRLSDCAR